MRRSLVWMLCGCLGFAVELSASPAVATQGAAAPASSTNGGAAAGTASARAAGRGAQEAPSVGLDRLLRLPESLDYEVVKRGGATRVEWQERFRRARADLTKARKALTHTEGELDKAADEADAWNLAPPGSDTKGAADAPLSYRLREQLRVRRAEVERAKKQLRDLDVQANLASVPEDWRH